MKAWAASLDPEQRSKIRFLADPHAAFTTALDLAYDATAVFGQPRSKRYALVIDAGRVAKLFVEPDNTGMTDLLFRFLPLFLFGRATRACGGDRETTGFAFVFQFLRVPVRVATSARFLFFLFDGERFCANLSVFAVSCVQSLGRGKCSQMSPQGRNGDGRTEGRDVKVSWRRSLADSQRVREGGKRRESSFEGGEPGITANLYWRKKGAGKGGRGFLPVFPFSNAGSDRQTDRHSDKTQRLFSFRETVTLSPRLLCVGDC
nr:putative peroxiredoxin pmp20 [Quercus suber]